MALVVYDRVQETTATTGTGTITLSGAIAGYQSFAAVGNGNTTYYCIINGSAWEVGIGTYTLSGTTLARTTVLSNSNGNTSPITLSGGSQVFVTYPSEKSVNLDASGNVSSLGTITSGVWNGTTIPVGYGGTGVTTSTGSGSNVLNTSPTLVTPLLGTPTSGNLANCTGYPASALTGNYVSTFSAGTTGLTPSTATTGAITLAGTLAIANGGTGSTTAATVAGTGISVSGTFPNQTITNTGVTSLTTSSGLSTNTSATGAVSVTNTGVTSIVAGTGISISGATGAVTITNSTTSPIPSGTVMLFYQSSAPTGWTQVTSLNDYALRIVSGSGGVTGGSTAFSTVFANQTPTISGSYSIGSTTLDINMIPSHSHNTNAYTTNFHYASGNSSYSPVFFSTASGNAGNSGSHNHSISGAPSSSAITLNVTYADFILASKN